MSTSSRRPLRIAQAAARYRIRAARRRVERLFGRSYGFDAAYYEAVQCVADESTRRGITTAEAEVLAGAAAAEVLMDTTLRMRLLESLKADSPRMLHEQRRLNAGFEKRLYKRWGIALDLFYQVEVACEEIGEQGYRAACSTVSDTNQKALLEAVSDLHARACRTALEVHELLAAGFPMGAHARARTIHELAVVSIVLSDFGSQTGHEDIGLRYMAFDRITNWRDACEYQEHVGRLHEEPFTIEEMDKIKTARDDAVQMFPDLDTKLGWAGDLPGLKSRNLKELEVIAGLDHLRPYYSWASHEVHANPKGARLNRKDGPDGEVKLAGRINHGLADPAQTALIALHQVTRAMLTCPGVSTPSTVMGAQAVEVLLEEACTEFARIEIAMREEFGLD